MCHDQASRRLHGGARYTERGDTELLTLGGARKAPILWGTGEEQALGGALVERNRSEAARRNVS